MNLIVKLLQELSQEQDLFGLKDLILKNLADLKESFQSSFDQYFLKKSDSLTIRKVLAKLFWESDQELQFSKNVDQYCDELLNY